MKYVEMFLLIGASVTAGLAYSMNMPKQLVVMSFVAGFAFGMLFRRFT